MALATILFLPSARADVVPRLPQVEVRQDRAADFAAFQTYFWTPVPRVGAVPPAEISVLWHVEDVLRRRGLKKVAVGPADLRASFGVRAPVFGKPQSTLTKALLALGSVSANTYQPQDRGPDREPWRGWPPDLRQWEIPAGTLLVELSRGSGGQPVWQGVAVLEALDEKRLDAAIREAVARLFKEYPRSSQSPR
jgi:hypothetical protein